MKRMILRVSNECFPDANYGTGYLKLLKTVYFSLVGQSTFDRLWIYQTPLDLSTQQTNMDQKQIINGSIILIQYSNLESNLDISTMSQGVKNVDVIEIKIDERSV